MNTIPFTARPLAPATFTGVMKLDGLPAIELFNLTKEVAGQPIGSTVSRDTIERAGFYLPEQSVRERRRAAWYLRNHAA
jgi:hypothetical protein